MPLSDEDRTWLKALQGELWPPKDPHTPMEREVAKAFDKPLPEHPKPREQITREELFRALDLIEPTPLVVSLYCSGMFGGVGITLLEHEEYIGMGATELLSISEQHLPRLCRDDAWELFTKYAFTPRNLEWCKRYGIKLRTDRVHYCY